MRSLLISAVISTIPLISEGKEETVNFQQLVENSDIAAKAVEHQSTIDTIEAKKLADFIHQDLSKNRAKLTLEFLRSHGSSSPSWQIIANAVITHNFKSYHESEQLSILGDLFKATVRKDDFWLNYAPPRGWTDPYTFRDNLAREIVYLKTGSRKIAEEENHSIYDDPNKWLSKYVPEEVSSSPEKPVEVQRPAKDAESRAASAAGSPSMTLSKTTPEFPRWAVLTGAGVLIMGVLAILLKNRRNRS